MTTVQVYKAGSIRGIITSRNSISPTLVSITGLKFDASSGTSVAASYMQIARWHQCYPSNRTNRNTDADMSYSCGKFVVIELVVASSEVVVVTVKAHCNYMDARHLVGKSAM